MAPNGQRAAAEEQPTLGEWACLAALASEPAHGFAVAARLQPGGDLGRVWSVSRPLTYRAVDRLAAWGWIEPRRLEQGIAGGTRTVFAVTRRGRSQLDRWLSTPVAHVRDVRSELLLKLVVGDLLEHDASAMLAAQLAIVTEIAAVHTEAPEYRDPAHLWRGEMARAAVRFVERMIAR